MSSNTSDAASCASELSQANVDRIFSVSDAPFLQYLRAFRDPGRELWSTKEAYEDDLERLTQLANNERGIRLPRDRVELLEEYMDMWPGPLAQIIDITTESCIRERKSIPCSPDHKPMNANAVSSFANGLHTCTSDVHTRLIVLRRPDLDLYAVYTHKLKAAVTVWKLLFYHILGIELELRPADVMALKNGDRDPPITRPNLLHLYDGDLWLQMSAAMLLGKRSVGESSPYCVVVVLSNYFIPSDCDSPYVCIDMLGRLPPPSEVASRRVPKPSDHSVVHSPLTAFVNMLHQQPGAVADLPPEEPYGLWLHPLLLRQWAHRSMEFGLHLKKAKEVTDHARVLGDMKKLRTVLNEELRAVRSFVLSAGYSACNPLAIAIDHLDRLSCQMSGREDELRATYDMFTQRKVIENARLSIIDSRSAIALTALAFAFVPLSLTSSIFGMNIQEINGTGHHIWAFVVTAMIMLLASFVSWLMWRAWHNIQYAIDKASAKEGPDKWGREDAQDFRAKYTLPFWRAMYDLDYRRRYRISLLLGWKSAEKTVDSHENLP